MKNFLIKTVLCGLWMGHLAAHQVSQPRGNLPSKANKMPCPEVSPLRAQLDLTNALSLCEMYVQKIMAIP